MIADIKKLIKQTASAEIDIEVSASDKPEFGHYSTNAAFKLAPIVRKSPLEIAKDLSQKLGEEKIFSKVEAVAPGFINFWISSAALQGSVAEILKENKNFGKLSGAKSASGGLKVNLEFVSANPTGPLTMANGRGGFYGTALANVLEKTGHKVTREYYVNDAGNQVRKLALSILAEKGFVPKFSEHYQGGYIKEWAMLVKLSKELEKKLKLNYKLGKSEFEKGEKYQDENAEIARFYNSIVKPIYRNHLKDLESIGKKTTLIALKSIKKSLQKAGIRHDNWFSEDANLHKKGELKKALEFLKNRKVVEEKDGATWLKHHEAKPQEFARPNLHGKFSLGLGEGVLIKSDGLTTYFLADLAYHYNKLIKRKFDLAIDIWGADHHGYAQRMKKGVEALGLNSERLKILITQLVRLVSGGKEVRMSKRKGEFITMDDLLEEVGADAAKFFFLMHSLDTHMDFDMDLAKEKSNKNPVFYAQYALVRCSNILRKSKAPTKVGEPTLVGFKNLKLEFLTSESEVRLMLELMKFPDLITQTAEDYQVHHLTKYAGDVARALHNFYEKERVVGLEDKKLERARLALVSATKIVLENLFDILGISKPKKM